MIRVCGNNEYFQLCEVTSSCNIFNLSNISPSYKLRLDPSTLLSYSVNYHHSVWITNDGVAHANGDNNGSKIHNYNQREMKGFRFYGNSGDFKLTSAVCGQLYTLYLGLSIKNSTPELIYMYQDRTKKSPLFLNIEKRNPVALFGGCQNSASIDSDGSIIAVNESVFKNVQHSPHFLKLPDNERAISVACCNDFIIVLSSNGRVFESTLMKDLSFNYFVEVNEFRGINIINVSGIHLHCLAVSDDGRVFAKGSNSVGQLGLEKGIKTKEFTEIVSLRNSNIVAAYAGCAHSFFQSSEGKLFACGSNINGQLFINTNEDYFNLPTETSITKGASFCIAGNALSVVFIDCKVPPNEPNKATEDIITKLRKKNAQKIQGIQSEQNNKLIEMKDREIEKLKNEIENLQRKFEYQKIKIKKLEKDIKSKNDEIESQKDESESKNEEIDSQKIEIEFQKEEIESQKNEIKSQKKEIESLKVKVKTQKDEIESQKAKIETQKNEIKSQKGEIESQKNEIKSQKGEIESLKRKIKDIKSKNELNESQDEIVSKNEEIESLKEKIKSQNEEIEKSKKKERDQLKIIKIKNKQLEIAKKQQKEIQILDIETLDQIKIEEVIGHGATSQVFKVAKQEIYALKQFYFDNNSENNETKFKKILHEYEILNQLNHPNIIKEFGIFFGDKTHHPSIMLEYCPHNLKAQVKLLSKKEQFSVIYEISLAMKYVHSKKIIHRDLKPENILLDADKRVKLCDFGHCTIFDGSSLTSMVGTYKFMAPEILREQTDYNEKVDVYSFGVVLYFILSKGDMPEIKLQDAINGLKADIPPTFGECSSKLINKCWENVPNNRPSFSEICEELIKKKDLFEI